MIEIIKELDIEVSKPNIFQAIVAKQYDMNTRFLKVTFMDSGTRIDIPYIETAKVLINAERKDGQSKGFDGVINDDGTVTVPLHSWMLELDGTVICDISVIDTKADDNKKLTTTSFTLLVEKASYGGSDITSDPQYDVMVSLMETCKEASMVAQEALEKSNEANNKYDACVEATENANAASEELENIKEELAEGGYITGIKERNNGAVLGFWIGTTAEYEALAEKPKNTYVVITDDNSLNERVVEQGTKGVWEYRIWKSGVCEFWADLRNIPSEPTGTLSHEFTTAYPFAITNDIVNATSVKFGWAHTQPMYIEKYGTSMKIRYYFDVNGTVPTMPDVPFTQCEFSFDVYVKGRLKK